MLSYKLQENLFDIINVDDTKNLPINVSAMIIYVSFLHDASISCKVILYKDILFCFRYPPMYSLLQKMYRKCTENVQIPNKYITTTPIQYQYKKRYSDDRGNKN